MKTRLRLPNKAQAADVLVAIRPKAAAARRRLQKPFALVEPDGFNTDITSRGELADRQRIGDLTLYHGTDPI